MNATYQIGLFGWVLHDIKEVYDSLDETERDEIILRDGNGQLTGDVNPVLFTDSFALLQQFNPPKWDSKIQDIVFKSMVTFRTPNLLWAQILLLDIAIHFLVRGGWHVGPGNEYNLWSTSVVSVITATVDSWDDIVKDEGTVQEKSGPSVGNPSNSVTPIVGTKLNTGAEAQGTVHAGVHGAENSLTEGQQGSRPAANGAKSSEAAGASSGATATSEKRHVRIGKASAESSESEPPPPDYSSMGLNWDLIGSLRKQAALFADLDEGLREYRLEKLATLLQLRALFFIAHKMLIPDSTDVYLAEGSNVTMPMI